MGGAVFLSCLLFGMGCPALELADHWVDLGLSLETEISGRALADWYYVGLGGLWWSNVLNSALPSQRLRPDSRPGHQDPVSHTTAASVCHYFCFLSLSTTGHDNIRHLSPELGDAEGEVVGAGVAKVTVEAWVQWSPNSANHLSPVPCTDFPKVILISLATATGRPPWFRNWGKTTIMDCHYCS